jgi:hypothetical protein
MAIPAAPSINDGHSTPVAQTFETLRIIPNGTDRIKNGSSVQEPEVLAIRHTPFPANAKTGKAAYDRRTVSFSKTVVDDEEKEHVVTFTASLIAPRTAAFDSADYDDAVAYVSNFWASYQDDLYLGKS